jgi:hypothetical protein
MVQWKPISGSDDDPHVSPAAKSSVAVAIADLPCDPTEIFYDSGFAKLSAVQYETCVSHCLELVALIFS